jgi:hypothetical protein
MTKVIKYTEILLTLYAFVCAAITHVFYNFSVSDYCLCLGCVSVTVCSKKLGHFAMKECIRILNVNPSHCLDPRPNILST